VSTTPTPSSSRVYDVVYRQEQYAFWRRFFRDFLLCQIGFRLLVKVRVEGNDHIPADGPTLMIMNHIGAIDPFVVVGIVRSRFVVPMSKAENYRNPVTALIAHGWGAYPVRRGEVDRRALDSTIELLNRGYAVLIAPEGTRHPALAEAKNGMTYVAARSNALIVPVGLDGTDQFPGSFKRLRRAQVLAKIGRPFRFRIGTQERLSRDEMRQMTREAMYQLAALLPEQRRGGYGDFSRMTTDYLEFVD
jgi:1-acyl-sn-glycerol-3-phosphate acyltransferase